MTESGTTYWHIAFDGYKAGDDLLCRDRLADLDTPWKWADAEDGFDADVVCLFPDTPRGRTEADWMWFEYPTYHLLRVEVPADAVVDQVEEGYPAIIGRIPGEWITLVRSGYAENTVTREGDKY